MLSLRKPPTVVADRLTSVFAAHDIEVNQIPRLLPSIRYKDLESPKTLLPAITPAVIDQTARLFGIRSAWLEGLDDVAYQPTWARGNPRAVLAVLAQVNATRRQERIWFPLRVLTTSMRLDRSGRHHQWLLPVIVEVVDELGDTLVQRCHVFGDPYDWTNEASRLELKAIAKLVWDQLKTPVPLLRVTPEDLEDVSAGRAIPSVASRRGLITSPSLEDFVLSQDESVQAKESDELAKLQAYLDASGLRECRLEAPFLPNRTIPPEEAAPETEDATPAIPAKSTQRGPMAGGKKQARLVSWDAIRASAQAIWAEHPTLTYAEVIRRLKTMPHLKAGALTDSAIHKQIRPVAPPEVRRKPGRKPKKSA